MAKSDTLTSNFVAELFAAALEKRTVFDIVRQYLKFSYLQIESEKSYGNGLQIGMIKLVRFQLSVRYNNIFLMMKEYLIN